MYRGEKGGWEMYEVEHSWGEVEEEEVGGGKENEDENNEDERKVVDALDLTKPDVENRETGRLNK